MAKREIEARTQEGTVVRDRKGYYVKTGRRKLKIPTDFMATRSEVAKLVGKEVTVAFSQADPNMIVAIGHRPSRRVKCYWIICYVPAPEFLTQVRPVLREKLLRNMVAEDVISKSLAREIRLGF